MWLPPRPRNAARELIDMPRGGARNRSGPQPDENSLKAAKTGFVLTALPVEGYAGETPDWPLEGKTQREADVWAEAWMTPQACAWIGQSWRWRTVALWVRWSVRMEHDEAPAALGNVVVRLADQIGMTPAGLKENGWKIAANEVSSGQSPAQPAQRGPARKSARDRLKLVHNAPAAG
jgi:hypothetical protein